MFGDIGVLHREGSRPFERNGDGDDGIYFWETCLRKVAFGAPESLVRYATEPGDEILRGARAFQLCLEIACGLRSPLVGETEVFGQFKKAAQAFELQASPWEFQFRRFLSAVIEDSKRVRSAHLDSLGSQSYGSVVRREVRGLRSVHVLGAGELVKEMLPWVAKDGVRLRVHARNPAKARGFLGATAPGAEFSGLDERAELEGAEALVIAAPMSAREIERWLGAEAAGLRIVIDLRADSDTDRVAAPGSPEARALTLPDVMNSVDSHGERIQARKAAALEQIEDLAAARARHVEYRPFGWEDVCA